MCVTQSSGEHLWRAAAQQLRPVAVCARVLHAMDSSRLKGVVRCADGAVLPAGSGVDAAGGGHGRQDRPAAVHGRAALPLADLPLREPAR